MATHTETQPSLTVEALVDFSPTAIPRPIITGGIEPDRLHGIEKDMPSVIIDRFRQRHPIDSGKPPALLTIE